MVENKTWFECIVECVYSDEVSAKDIKEKNNYLIDAMSFTEAEARMVEKIKEMPRGEYSVKKLNILKLDDLYDDGDFEKWWKVKVVIEEEDDRGKKKKFPFFCIIHSDNAEDAAKMVSEKYAETIASWSIKEVKEYPMTDYFRAI